MAAALTALAIIGTFLVQWQSRKTRVSHEAAQSRLDGLKETRSQPALRAANIRADKLEHDTQVLKEANLKLEAEIAPRDLSNRQKAALSNLTPFSGRAVGIKSDTIDTEGLRLATQILDALTKSHFRIEDNRLTIQPSGSVTFGVLVEGTDRNLVDELKRILSMDGHLAETSSLTPPNRGGVSVHTFIEQ